MGKINKLNQIDGIAHILQHVSADRIGQQGGKPLLDDTVLEKDIQIAALADRLVDLMLAAGDGENIVRVMPHGKVQRIVCCRITGVQRDEQVDLLIPQPILCDVGHQEAQLVIAVFPGNGVAALYYVLLEIVADHVHVKAALDRLSAIRIVPVLVLDNLEDGLKMCSVLQEKQLPAAEITFRTAAAEESIRRVAQALPEVLVGAGTVLLPWAAFSLLLGNHTSQLADGSLMGSGTAGEICAIALLIGLAYMLWKKIITWHIPVSIIGTVFVFSGLLHLASPVYANPVDVILAGGLMLGAIFMATDYVTSPMTAKGQIIYGVAIGFLTVVIRNWGSYPEGMSFAILIMNGFTPLINTYIKPKRFGEVPEKK